MILLIISSISALTSAFYLNSLLVKALNNNTSIPVTALPTFVILVLSMWAVVISLIAILMGYL